MIGVKKTNRSGMGCYYHIIAVVKNSESLAEKYGADKEVVLIAAWLHDIASVINDSLYHLHHIHGAEMAYSLLTGYGYGSKKIRMVQECIRNHRGSVSSEKNSLEELCAAAVKKNFRDVRMIDRLYRNRKYDRRPSGASVIFVL